MRNEIISCVKGILIGWLAVGHTVLEDVIITNILNRIFDYSNWIMQHGFVAACAITVVLALNLMIDSYIVDRTVTIYLSKDALE